MNARFQSHKADFRPVYHCDSQTWAAAWYGNIDAPYEAGTSFYAHKETGLRGGEPNINGAFGRKYLGWIQLLMLKLIQLLIYLIV